MNFSSILSCISLLSIVSFQSNIIAMDIPAPHVEVANDTHATFTCQICFDDKPLQECCFLVCGHQYCRECLNTQFAGAIQENNLAQMRCPHPDCGRGQLTEQDVWEITQGDRQLVQRFADRLAAEHINQERNIRQCPSANCRYAFINENGVANTMRCPGCNEVYCSNCLQPHPTTTTCAAAAEIRTLNNPDVAARTDAAWLAENTRDCPRCNRRILKDGGCLHMTCRGCRYEFCWHCLRRWSLHRDNFNCNAPRIARNPNILPIAAPAPQPAPQLQRPAYQAPQPEYPMGHPANPQGQYPRNHYQQYEPEQRRPQVRNANREAAAIFAVIAATGTYFAGKYLWNKFKKPAQQNTVQDELPIFDEEFLNGIPVSTTDQDGWIQDQEQSIQTPRRDDDWDF